MYQQLYLHKKGAKFIGNYSNHPIGFGVLKYLLIRQEEDNIPYLILKYTIKP